MTKRVLLVEDDDLLRRSLAEQIVQQEDFSAVTEAASGADAEQVLVGANGAVAHDIVLLDIGLPDVDGRDLCRQFRAGGVNVPIIMLTGADTDQDTVTGLDAGANDYVTKPFRLNVLLARMRAHLRQHEHSDDAIFTIGRYRFQPGAKVLLDAGRRIRLTEKEAAILRFLLRAGNRTVGRETLLHEVWGYNANVTTHTLETHVYRLRQKMERDPSNATLLVTEPGGYRLAP